MKSLSGSPKSALNSEISICNFCLLGILFMSNFSHSLLVQLKAILFPVSVLVSGCHVAV